MDGKPIIRHCRNCEWCGEVRACALDCEVKYKSIFDDYQRITALFCKHYKQKGSDKQ